MILRVARIGHPVIRAAARAVAPESVTSPDFQRLLRDMAAVAAELNLERPSDELRQRLKDWIRQAQSGRSDHQPPVDADADVSSSPVDEV